VDGVLRPPASAVRVERIVADDQPIDASGVSLPAGTAHLRIDFTVPTLTAPARTHLHYRLEGYDRDWIDAGIRREASYDRLPAGDYRFAVRAEIPERGWTSQTATWDFRIAPAFYQTRWFYGLFAGVLLAAAGGAWRLRVRAVQRDLAAVYGERMRLGREIHDTLLQSLAGLALQLDGLEQRVAAADPGAGSQLQRIRGQMEGHIREVRESIWDLRSPAPRPRSLADALGDGVRRLVTDSVTLELDVVGAPRPCAEPVAQQLLRIAREAVINAVRHGKARSVRLKLAYDRRALRLTVTDDGCGFDPARADAGGTHYGLSAMRERAEAAGGSCVVASRPGSGTEVRVELPLTSRWSLQRLL
jgi:signal transduction histidine kinase